MSLEAETTLVWRCLKHRNSNTVMVGVKMNERDRIITHTVKNDIQHRNRLAIVSVVANNERVPPSRFDTTREVECESRGVKNGSRGVLSNRIVFGSLPA